MSELLDEHGPGVYTVDPDLAELQEKPEEERKHDHLGVLRLPQGRRAASEPITENGLTVPGITDAECL